MYYAHACVCMSLHVTPTFWLYAVEFDLHIITIIIIQLLYSMFTCSFPSPVLYCGGRETKNQLHASTEWAWDDVRNPHSSNTKADDTSLKQMDLKTVFHVYYTRLHPAAHNMLKMLKQIKTKSATRQVEPSSLHLLNSCPSTQEYEEDIQQSTSSSSCDPPPQTIYPRPSRCIPNKCNTYTHTHSLSSSSPWDIVSE